MAAPSLRPSSLVVAAGRPHEPGAPINTPISPASAYRPDPERSGYARARVNDTVAAFEDAVGVLEGGTALAFASGMAALAAVAEGRPAHAIAVVPREGYSGTVTMFDEQQKLGRMSVRAVDPGDTAAVIAALDGADLLWLETVSNPLLTVADLPAIAAAAHERGVLVGVDATVSTPLVVRPLDLGADLVMHSATKYLAGHSDALLGVLVARSSELVEELHTRRTNTGGVPGTLEAYLALRGMRTLAVRMERAQANAGTLARRLSEHPGVGRVRYPGLPDHPTHAIAARDHAGFGALMSFELAAGSIDAAERLCAAVELITHATSLGGVESLIERRGRYAIDAGFGAPEALLRLSVGIEDVDDLWADLTQAIDAASALG